MIHETIVTTTDARGKPHIAPMGVREEGGLLVLAAFKPSATLENLKATGAAVVNFCDDVRVFAGCLTGRRDWPLVPAQQVEGMRLAAALAHAELKVERLEDDELRPRAYCRTVAEYTHAPFRGFNRAQSAVIEAAILVSRLDMLPAEKVEREIAYLTIAIDKTAGEREREAWSWLMERIHHHRLLAEQPAP